MLACPITRDRIAPVNGEVRALLREMRETPSATGEDFLFEYRTGSNVTYKHGTFHIALRRAGVEDFRFNDLRRTFASRAKSHTDAFTLRALLGHSSVEMADLYAQVSIGDLQKAVEDLRRGGGAATLETTRIVPQLSQRRRA